MPFIPICNDLCLVWIAQTPCPETTCSMSSGTPAVGTHPLSSEPGTVPGTQELLRDMRALYPDPRIPLLVSGTPAPDVLWPPPTHTCASCSGLLEPALPVPVGSQKCLNMYVLLETTLNQWWMGEGSKFKNSSPARPHQNTWVYPTLSRAPQTRQSQMQPQRDLAWQQTLAGPLPLPITLPVILPASPATLPHKSRKSLPLSLSGELNVR